ncbi:hypothetical protein EJB05_09544, partial [Eragrostis curvula]
MAKISDKLRNGSSSSGCSDAIKVKAKNYRRFCREKPVHSVLGGGKRESEPLSSSSLRECGSGEAAAMRNTQPSRMTATGFNFLLLAVAVGVIGSGGFALLLGFLGLLAGACLIAVRVQMADDLAPAVITGVGGLIAFLHRNIAVVGVALASSAVTAVASEESSQICFDLFALFLLGMCLVIIGVHRE